ncbi:hypothetical protein F511_27255 [Dorcoceras hygrometricum]|uniref:Dystroglycan-like n=1 Tax=Dorcoceras hygrometricum TaxID=472368 RepID=A0A2Z7C9D9_9LAMI|nr:hypothetical protein F511_27255 [Dorcoceras hygrometricum]
MMASSLISSSHHIDLDLVFGIDDAGMVQMFESLIATGLKDFLGCPAVFSEAALTEFFANSSVRDGMVVSTIKGKAVEIFDEVFATTFELPTEGLTYLSEVPKNLVCDARSLFSVSQEQVSISCFKKEMEIQYHLLSDILAKNIYVKVESFDAVTRDRFLLMTAITFDIKVNWSRLLFDVLKDMVTPGSRQAKGVLNEKTVHRYVTINEKVGAEEVTDAPRVKKTPAKKAVSQKRPAVDAVVAPMIKKKRTIKGKPVAMETVAVAQEAVPLQIFEATTDAPVEQSPVPKRKIQKRKRRLVMETDDEINVEKQTAIENLDEQVGKPVDEPVAGQPEVVPVAEATTDGPDAIIEQVLDQLDSLATTDGGDQPAATSAEERHWFDLPYEDLMARLDAERLVVTPSDTDEDMDTGRTVGTHAIGYFVEEPAEEMAQVVEDLSADEAMSLEDILMTITVGVPLPSACVEITKITLGKEIKINRVTERTWFLASLPQIPDDNKGKEILVEKDPVKGDPVKEHIMLILADIEYLVNLRKKVIDEVQQLFYSFSLKRLSNLKIDESYYAKEELVLTWAEAESTGVALQRKVYILMKYRKMLLRKFLEARKMNFVPGVGDSAVDLKILNRLSNIHSFVLEELRKEIQAHGLTWKKTCCSKISEGRPRDRGANKFFSRFSSEDITTVFAFRLSQFCIVFIQNKFFSRFSSEDITSIVASIASERTFLRNVQIFQTSGSVAPRIQLLDEHPLSASTSEDSAMNFDEIDTAATSTSLPAASIPKITEALAQLRASIEQISESDDGAKHKDTLLLHLHDFERKFTARFDAQDRVLGALRKDSNDQRILMSLDLKSSHTQLSTQIATNALDVVDIRRVVREHHQKINAKITSLDEQLAATRNDLLEFSAQAQQTLNIITDQLRELVAYINRGGNDKKGEVGSSRGPQPPPDDQN